MEIAVIGIACRYPGASSAAELFENVLAGRRYFREVPPQRWALADYYDADRSRPDHTYCKQAALLEGFEFNAGAFRIPQTTSRATDLAQWLALTVAKDALDDADVGEPPRTQTAVILGNTLTGETSRANLIRYRWPYARRVFAELLDALAIDGAEREEIMKRIEERYKRPFPPVNEDNLAGGLANTIAGRICNFFDFKGGGYTVDGACSSSLLAIQEASIGLEQGLCDLALAGGVDMSLDPFELVGFAKVGALSDSDIRVYDQRANGFLPGEGCGIVVLKRLGDALRDRNRVYGVIRGVGYSSDGRGGITAPSVAGQSLAVDRAYSMAGYSFADVELIEGHGTGTPVGDRTELQTFLEAKRRHGAVDGHRCGIGSIKSIIGHTKAAAGVAGFIKATLSVYHRVLPPTMGLGIPNEIFTKTPHIYPLMRGGVWRSGGPLRAAVSSAGFGGINTHITVESPPASSLTSRRTIDAGYLLQSHQNAELFLLAADDGSDLLEQVNALAPVAKRLCHAELGDLAAHCARSVTTKPLRLAVVADSAASLHEKLLRVSWELSARSGASQLDWSDPSAGIFLRRSKRPPRVAFMFPGQGAQNPDMTRSLRDRFPFLVNHWRTCDEALESSVAGGISRVIFTDEAHIDADEERARGAVLRATNIAQPAIVAASMATAEVLMYLGIDPDVVMGHSLGEYTALWCAGALDKSELLRLVALRGSAMMVTGGGTNGGMLSIAADAEKVRALIAEVGGQLTIANYNAPTQIVVSGASDALESLSQLCAVSEIPTTRLDVSGPFHSPMMEGAQRRLREVLPAQRWRDPQRLVISTTTGELLSGAEEILDVLGKQIVSPVQFTRAMQTALAEGVDMLIDVGPAPVLFGLARRELGERTALAFTADVGSGGDWTGWLQTVGYAFVSGLPVLPTRLFENRFLRAFKWPYEPRFIVSPCELPVEPLVLQHRSIELARVSPPAEASQPAVAVAADIDARSPAGLLGFMRQLIMERFGYPPELVQPDARLADDLNLDSIKSAEIIAEAMARVDVRSDPALFGRLSLAEIASRLAAKSSASSPEQEQPLVPGGASWVRTFAARLAEAPLGEPVRETPSVGRIVVAALPHDRGGSSVVEQLRGQGIAAQLWHQGESLEGNSEVAGCIVLLPHSQLTKPGSNSISGQQLFEVPDFLLDVVHEVCRHFPSRAAGNGASDGTPFLAVVMRTASLLGFGGLRDDLDTTAASAALVKSWFLEHPGFETRVLDMEIGASAPTIIERLFDELTCGNGYVEAAYTRSGRRHVVEYVPVSNALMSPAASELTSGDVMVVTGGAKGITAQCLQALAERVPFAVALLGTSPPPSAGESTNEISQTLQRLTELSVQARYYQCDVTDSAAVRACMARVGRELGVVRGIIHAAGINVPHKLADVSRPAFRSVLEPKMLGLLNLLEATDPGELRELVLFSSVIGASGMAGNADYAYANAWMGLVLRWLAPRSPYLRARSFAFSIWDQVGMGARQGSVEVLRRMGIGAIPVAEGTRQFVELMHTRWRTTELLVTARAAGLATLRFADRAPSIELPLVREIRSLQPGVELISEMQLSPQRDRYIRDHDYKGALLFPAVVGMEAMAQAALRCVRLLMHAERPPVLENLRFIRPIVVPAEGRRVRMHVLAEDPQQDGTLRVHVEIRSSLDGYSTASFSGDCVWRAADSPRKRIASPVWPEPLPIDPQRDLYGSLFFQGPMFQHVTALHDVSATHCIAQVRVPPEPEPEDATGDPGRILGMVSIRDCYLHAIQVCVPEFRILPIGMESLETFGLEGPTAFIVATERSRTAEEFTYDIDVVSPDGRVFEQLRGYRCRIVDAYEDRQTLERIARIHAFAAERQLPRPASNLR
jgi:enediyne polyketide synthase